ncbi:MAG: NAD(P)H-binding protein [Anaerolineae bacterium]|nr:NAD(P)H-binding protein [Thermoflexales bacterium]MDW8395079.1 NAD(P)H-binding protein [Anaerolineae bacterium]
MILITGASGYVAGHTLKALQNASLISEVTALVRTERGAEKVRALGARPAIGDVTDVESVRRAMQGAEKVIHLAAVNRDRGPVTMERVNAQGTINVVNAARELGVKHVITVVGLGADASRPFPLASTQGRGVDYLMASGVPYTVLEASVIFGPGDEFINTLAGLARIPPFMVVPGDGKARFQPIAVQDVANCVVQSLRREDVVNKRLQICGSEVITLEGIIDAILDELKVKRIKVYMPVPLLKVAVKIMEAVFPKPPVTSSLLAQLGVDNVATDNATEKIFGIRPIRLRDGIGFVNEMTVGKLVARTLGRIEYR